MYILTLENKDNHSVNTDFIVGSFNQKEVLHQSLKQADDTIKLSIPFSADIWNFINANKLIKAKITKDGESYFTGYIRPDFDYSKIQRFQPIQLELVNATYITSFYEIESAIAYKDTTLGAIVSNLLSRAEITGQDTSFLDEPIVFDIIEEGTTVKDALSQILFEYGYFWDFDKNGEFTVQKIYNENVTPSVVLDGTNILEKVQVSKKEQEFDRVEVEYDHLEKFDNLLIFQDNTGKKGGERGCFINLTYGKYLGQIEGETSYDITYDSEKGEVIWVDNASLSILANPKDKLQTTFTNKNTKGNLSIYNPTTGSIYILLLEVYGTAYVKTIESATIKVGQDGKNKSIKSKHIHSKEAAENFAKMYYDWGKSCDYAISLQSKLNLDVGTIVEVNAAGKIIGRVIEKTTKLDGKPFTYKIEAIKEYELPEITSSILRKSSPIGTAARGTGILKIDTAPDAYTTPVSGITPAFRISKDVVKSQSKVDEVYTGDILQYSYYQYQVILVADDYVYTAARTSIRGSAGAKGDTGATGATGSKGDKGDTGATGKTGATGATGPAGPKGDKGEDGTSVKILGTKPSVSDLPAKGEIGDAWLVNGNLYVWADNSWENVGNIQGPKGDKGDTGKTGATGNTGATGATGKTGATGATGKNATQYYIHYVYCDDTDLGTNYSTTDTRKYVGVYVDTVSADATSFAKVPSDVIWSQIEGDKGDTGAKGDKGDKGDTGATGKTGAAGAAGVGVKSITEYYLATSSNSGITTSSSGWTTTIQTINSTKKYLWNYEKVTYTNNSTSTTTPTIIGAYGDTGPAGPKGANGGTGPQGPVGPVGATGATGATGDTGATGATGKTGATGIGIKSITEYYLATSSSSGITTSTDGWTTDIQTLESTKKYLWNYEKITYTNNTTSSSTPVIIGTYGDKGDTGATGKTGATGATGKTGATGAQGTKTFFSDYTNRTWDNAQWNTYSATNYATTWYNSTVAGMRVGDTLVITATLSEKGNSKGQIFAQITSIPTSKNSSGYYEIPSKTVSSLIGEKGATGSKGDKGDTGATGKTGATGSKGDKGDTGATGQRGGRDLAITTAPASYTTAIAGFTPSYRIALSTVKTQSGISTVYVGDTLVYGVYRYPVGYVDASYVYTAARTSVKGDKGDTGATGATGASSRTIAYRINYSTFTGANNGEIYVCGYNSAGAQADVAGYVIVNGATHYIKGMFNPNVPTNGYVAAEIGGTSASPKTPFYIIYDWWSGKYYKIENGQEINGKTWNQLFTEITNKANYVVLGKVASSGGETALKFEETTPCLLSSIIEDEVNLTYQGVVATTADMNTNITPYKFSQDENGNWIKTVLNVITVRKWAFVLCMNAATPTSSTAAPVIKLFNGTWWVTVTANGSYYSSMQSMMAGDLPAVAGYYDTLGLAIPSICGTYIKTLTSNKAFINELFANDITVGNKISTPFTPTTSLRCYVEYATPGQTNWTTDLSKVYNSSAGNGAGIYTIRFGYKVPGLSTQIPVGGEFTSTKGVTGVAYAFSTVDSPYTVPNQWTTITKTSFPNTANISSSYKWLFIQETFPSQGSPAVYALPCYTTSTRSDGFEIKSDGSAIFTGKTRFEGGIGIVCDAKDVVRNGSSGLLTIAYHFPIDFKIYDVIIFLEPATSQGGTILLYKFTCVRYTHFGKTGMTVYKTYDNTSNHSTVIEASVEDDQVGYNSQQLPNGYRDDEHLWLQKVVIKQKTPNFPIAAVKGVIIPYMEAD